MASWSKDRVEPNAINGGREFTTDDNLALNELNAIVNNSFYASEKSAEALGKINDIIEHEQGTVVTINDSPQAEWKADFAESERQKSKNLFKVNNNAGYSITRNGVTATINEDYTITLNGACTATTYFNIFNTISGGADFVNTYKKLYLDSNKTYTYLLKVISGSYSGINSQSQLTMTFRQTDGTGVVQGKSIDLSITDNNISNLAKSGIDYLNNGYFRTLSGITYTNYTFGLMICEGEDTDYQAYNGAIVHEKDVPLPLKAQMICKLSSNQAVSGTNNPILFDNITTIGNSGLIAFNNGTFTFDSSIKYLKIYGQIQITGATSGIDYNVAGLHYSFVDSYPSGTKVTKCTINTPLIENTGTTTPNIYISGDSSGEVAYWYTNLVVEVY